MIYGFTGTRKGMSLKQKDQLKYILFGSKLIPGMGEIIFHHGGCIGADAEAHAIVVDARIRAIHIHWSNIHGTQMDRPALPLDSLTEIIVYQPMDPIRRDKIIVDSCDKLIAAPLDHNKEELRSGTWTTVRYARRVGKQVLILER